MHQELIRELAMITDEERRILEGKQEIDPQLYTEKKEMVVDSAKLLKKGKLIQVRPYSRSDSAPGEYQPHENTDKTSLHLFRTTPRQGNLSADFLLPQS